MNYAVSRSGYGDHQGNGLGGNYEGGFGGGYGGGYSCVYDDAQCGFGAGGNRGGFTNKCVRRHGGGYEGEAWRLSMKRGLQMQGCRVNSPKVKIEEVMQAERGTRDR